MLRDFPCMVGHPLGRMKVRTLMKMGVQAMERKRELSKWHDAYHLKWMEPLVPSGYLGAE